MKKLFVFAVAAGMFFVACNGGSTPAADSTATTTVDTMNAAPTVAAPVDSAAHVDSSAAAHVDSAAAATPAK